MIHYNKEKNELRLYRSTDNCDDLLLSMTSREIEESGNEDNDEDVLSFVTDANVFDEVDITTLTDVSETSVMYYIGHG